MASEHCCEPMHYWASYQCAQHPTPENCPDNLIFYSASNKTYGIRIHDGGSSYIEINHCPWCGEALNPDP
jgi:hypothetical protein